MESRKAQLEAMQSSKQSDFERDFERDSARYAKVLSNPTTLVRAPAPSANVRAAFARVAEHEKACSSRVFRVPSGFAARPSTDFERPVAAER